MTAVPVIAVTIASSITAMEILSMLDFRRFSILRIIHYPFLSNYLVSLYSLFHYLIDYRRQYQHLDQPVLDAVMIVVPVIQVPLVRYLLPALVLVEHMSYLASLTVLYHHQLLNSLLQYLLDHPFVLAQTGPNLR